MIRAVLALLALLLLATLPADPRGSLPGNNPTLASAVTLTGPIFTIGSGNSGFSAANNWINFAPSTGTSGYNPVSTGGLQQGYAGATGTITNMMIMTPQTVTAITYWTVTLIKNGTDTALSCKLDNTTAYGTGFQCTSTASVTVAPTDLLSWRATATGSPPNTVLGSVQWIAGGSTKNEVALYSTSSNAASGYHAIGVGQQSGSTTETENESILPADGTVDQLYVYSVSGIGDPGGTVTVFYSDTYGSAVATAITCTAVNSSGTATCNDTTHSITVHKGGGISIHNVWNGAAGSFEASVRFQPATPGLFPVMSVMTNVSTPAGQLPTGQGGPTAANLTIAGYPALTAYKAQNFYCAVKTAPGAGTSRTVTVNYETSYGGTNNVTALGGTVSGTNTLCTPDLSDIVTIPASGYVNNAPTVSGSPAATTWMSTSWVAHP